METSAINGLGILALAAGSFVMGWVTSDRRKQRDGQPSQGHTAELQDVRFQVNHLMAVLTLTVRDRLQWEVLPSGARRLRLTREALTGTANAAPTLNTVLMARQDALGSEFVVELYPDKEARAAAQK